MAAAGANTTCATSAICHPAPLAAVQDAVCKQVFRGPPTFPHCLIKCCEPPLPTVRREGFAPTPNCYSRAARALDQHVYTRLETPGPASLVAACGLPGPCAARGLSPRGMHLASQPTFSNHRKQSAWLTPYLFNRKEQAVVADVEAYWWRVQIGRQCWSKTGGRVSCTIQAAGRSRVKREQGRAS